VPLTGEGKIDVRAFKGTNSSEFTITNLLQGSNIKGNDLKAILMSNDVGARRYLKIADIKCIS